GDEGEGGRSSVTVLCVSQRLPNPNPVRKNHACEACGKAFRDVYHLNRHRLSHSDEKPYSCPICQQRFKRKDRMSYHVRSHQGGVEKPYVCPHCAKGFSRPDHLNSHVRQVHSTERPFKCETCESAFATRDRLRAHMIRHEEKVPCHICGKLLSAAYITDHMRVHNQSQHHACHLCNRTFTTLTYLRVHAQKGGFGGTGAGGVLLCQLCGVQCKTPTQLQGHMGTHSGGLAATRPGSEGTGATNPRRGPSVRAPLAGTLRRTTRLQRPHAPNGCETHGVRDH
uniref:MYC associated zinc finger protein n=1 Tax=Scleropages formosus TaxID=113540 RepID=A0A8C9UXC2_SCLFO